MSHERIVFVDVDGVLAPWDSGTLDPACVARLGELLARSGAAAVITSSWREHASLDAIRRELREAGLVGAIVGTTPIRIELGRGAEISEWLEAHPEVRSFVVLDDEPIPRLGHRQVRTDEYDGLREADLERALALLSDG